MEKKVTQLQMLFSDTSAVKMVLKAPNLLSFQVYPTLENKVKQLQLLLPGINVTKVVAYAPTVLYHDIHSSIGPKVRALSELLPGCDVARLVSAVPALLCSDEKTVASKLLAGYGPTSSRRQRLTNGSLRTRASSRADME